jgi:hypothetical protein
MEEKEGNKTKQGGHCIWVRVALITCASRFPHHKRAGIAAAAAHPNPNPSPPWNRPPFRPIRRPRSTLPLSAPPGIESTPPPTASSTPGSWTPITGRLYRRRPRLPPRLLRLPTPPGCRTLPPQPHRSDLFSSALYPSHSLSLSIDLDILIRPSRIHLARKSITVATSHPGAVGVGITRRLIGAQVGGTMAAAAGGVARGATTMAVVEGAALLAGGEGGYEGFYRGPPPMGMGPYMRGAPPPPMAVPPPFMGPVSPMRAFAGPMVFHGMLVYSLDITLSLPAELDSCCSCYYLIIY